MEVFVCQHMHSRVLTHFTCEDMEGEVEEFESFFVQGSKIRYIHVSLLCFLVKDIGG